MVATILLSDWDDALRANNVPAFAQEPWKTGTRLRRANLSQQDSGKDLVEAVAKNSNRGGTPVRGSSRGLPRTIGISENR